MLPEEVHGGRRGLWHCPGKDAIAPARSGARTRRCFPTTGPVALLPGFGDSSGSRCASGRAASTSGSRSRARWPWPCTRRSGRQEARSFPSASAPPPGMMGGSTSSTVAWRRANGVSGSGESIHGAEVHRSGEGGGDNLNIERRRLEETRTREAPWRKWGPYLSERQWGTVREDYSESGDAWDYFSHDQARSRAYRWGEDGLAGISDDQPAALLRAGPVEREGPDPQGAAVRPDEQRGEPRRGRQGVLLLPRLDADPLVHEVSLQVPAGGLSVRRPRRDQPAPEPARVRVRAARHGRVRSGSLLRRVRRIRQGVARRTSSSRSPSATADRSRRRCTCCRRSGSATCGHGVRQHPGRCSGRPAMRRRDRGLASGSRRAVLRRAKAPRRCSSPRTRPTPSASSVLPNRTPYVKDGIGNYIVHGHRDAVNPEQQGTKASAHYPAHGGAGESRTLRLRLSRRGAG